MKVYKNAYVNHKLQDIAVKDGKIIKLGNIDVDGEDLGGNKVYPGLIDIHIHGCMGFDTMDGNKLQEMSQTLLKHGITSWCPTTMTMDFKTIKRVVNIDLLQQREGAQIIGFHMEGPYIAKAYKGAQNEKFIQNPNKEEFESLQNIKLITIAPELPGSMEFIKDCPACVCIGHTEADYDCCVTAAEHGANCLTHTFNAMPPLHHRNAGPVGAAIEKDLYVQVICDGLHIHKSVIQMLYRTFGAKRMILISDCMRATGLEDGEYELGGQTIFVKESIAKTADGTIAGGTHYLFDIVKKAIEFGIPEEEAFQMASQTPAEMLQLPKGKIEVGYDADFIVVDSDLNLVQVIRS